MERFNEVTEKLNKMYKGQSEEKKDTLVSQMKNWVKSNKRDSDIGKYDAIKNFLAEQLIY